MTVSPELKLKFIDQLKKALGHLEKSFMKAVSLPTLLSKNSDDQLETWESFTARFARVVDIYCTKYLRAKVLDSDPGFDGTFLDLLNLAEKSRLIDSAQLWLKLRSLRNIQAHDYTDETFSTFVTELIKHTPLLLKLKIE